MWTKKRKKFEIIKIIIKVHAGNLMGTLAKSLEITLLKELLNRMYLHFLVIFHENSFLNLLICILCESYNF